MIDPTQKGIEIDGGTFRDLLSPGVYLFCTETEVLYVGTSNCLLARAAQRNHQQKDLARAEATKVFLFPQRTSKVSLSLEAEMILKFKPKYNKTDSLSAERIANVLGISKESARRLRYQEFYKPVLSRSIIPSFNSEQHNENRIRPDEVSWESRKQLKLASHPEPKRSVKSNPFKYIRSKADRLKLIKSRLK